MKKIDIQKQFKVKVNKDAERYEFNSVDNNSVSYTVGFHEVGSLEDAYIAVYLAIEKNQPAPPSSPAPSIEEQMNRPRFELHPAFSEDEYIFVSTLWKIYKSNPGTDGKKMAVAELREYASLKERETHNRAVQECIESMNTLISKRFGLTVNNQLYYLESEEVLKELEKLKK